TWTIDLSGYVPWPENKNYSVQSIDNGYLASEWAPEISEISNFTADFLPLQTCQNTETQFQDKSFSNDYPIATYLWEFIEGSTITTSAQQNPTYTFHSFGTHYVKLTITNSDGASTNTLKSFNVMPSPLVDFTAPAVCQGTPVLFDNTTSANTTIIEDWLWDFGDGTANSTLDEPGSHPYLLPNDYKVTLHANSSNGCSGTIEKTVSVATIPQAVIIASTPLSFCAGGSVILSTAKNSNYLYHWRNNGTAIANAVSDSLTVNQQGTYTVEVVNSIANCMTNSDPAIITIQPAPAPPLITPDENKSFCDGDSLMLSVTNTPGNNYFWKLNGGAVGLNSNTYAAKSAGTYSLEVSNSYDCSANSTNTINVNVHPNPTPPALSIEGEKAFCLGDSLKISVINNPDYSYQWMNNGVNISGETNNLFTAFNSGSYNLKISNSNLCEIESEIVQVTTKEIPDAPYINLSSVSPEFCQGDSIRLFITETPNYTYEWKQNGGAIGSGPSLYAKNPGEYSLLVENSIGCGNMATNSVQVIVNPLPDISPVSLSSSKEFCENETLVMSVPFNNLYTYQWSNEYGPIIDSTENSLSTSISGNYFVSISNQNGCKISTPPIKVTAKAIPTAPSIITENYIPGECAKDSPITLRVEQTVSDYDYQWKRNGIKLGSENQTYLQGYLSMGEYTVEAINTGCMNESPVQTIFFEDAPEKPDIVAEGPTVWYIACSNDSASNYWWFYNGEEISGADEYIYVANQNLGTYSVNIGNEKGCITSSDQITIPTGATGIDDMYSLNNLTLSPNPTKGILRVDMNNKLIGQLDMKIFTFEGKQIVHKQLEKSDQYFQTELDLSDQVDGIYLIVFMIDKYVTIEKIVVN
ncbi:MAG: PKD domain-containing protein, partial [Bacteroidales bacterium]|nr:PKD domain-containing protein [Bacteroidales bacterium]